MRIAIDAMGGDHAPRNVVEGALQALADLDSGDELILVGPERLIRAELPAPCDGQAQLRLENATEVIGMDETPVEAVRRKRDSSIVRMVKLGAGGQADAMISAGNTGALVAAGVLLLKPLAGVERPGIGVMIPTMHGMVILCDAGANIQPKPAHLHQYALLAGIYAEAILHIERPRVGLLNIGAEEEKGTPLVKETRRLLEQDPSLNYVGFIEGRDIFQGVCDVVITDGFTGNVTLKIIEGITASLLGELTQEARTCPGELLAGLNPILARIRDRYDHEQYGGAMLLGVCGLFLKVHGSGGARAIRNAVRWVKDAGARGIHEHIRSRLGSRMA